MNPFRIEFKSYLIFFGFFSFFQIQSYAPGIKVRKYGMKHFYDVSFKQDTLSRFFFFFCKNQPYLLFVVIFAAIKYMSLKIFLPFTLSEDPFVLCPF